MNAISDCCIGAADKTASVLTHLAAKSVVEGCKLGRELRPVMQPPADRRFLRLKHLADWPSQRGIQRTSNEARCKRASLWAMD